MEHKAEEAGEGELEEVGETGSELFAIAGDAAEACAQCEGAFDHPSLR